MALITTLMMVSVILVFLAGFIATNQTQIATLQLSSSQEALQRSCLSVSQFLQSRLEQDATWPSLRVGPGSDSATGESVVEIGRTTTSSDPSSSGYSAIIEGTFHPEQADFRAVLVNNLIGPSRLTLPDGRHRTVESEAVRIQITCWRSRGDLGAGGPPTGAYTETQTFNLRRAAHIDSTMVASNGILIDSRNVVFDSADELRNQIRSLRDVVFAGVVGLGFDGKLEAAPGVVWARNEIFLEDRRIREALSDLQPPEEMQIEVYDDQLDDGQAPEETKVTGSDLPVGQFMEYAVGEYSKPELSVEDIRKVAARHDDDLNPEGSSRPLAELTPGVYEFTVAEIHKYENGEPVYSEEGDAVTTFTNVLVHRASADPHSRIHEVYVPASQTFNSFSFVSATMRQAASNGLTRLHSADDQNELYQLPILSGSGAPPLIDLKNRALFLPSSTRYRVNGHFGVTANVLSDLTGDQRLALEGDRRPQLILSGHGKSRAYLEAKESIVVNGSVRGSGTIISEQNVDIEISKASYLVAGTDEGGAGTAESGVSARSSFAIFAGDSITVRGDNHQSSMSLAGLVYAHRNVLFDFSPEEEQADTIDFDTLKGRFASHHKGSFHLEGAVVAQEGFLAVRGLQHARFTYNPKYVGDLFASSANQMRLEPLSWWPY